MNCYLFPEPSYFFFSPDVPALFYYAYIPTIFITIFVGFSVFWNGRRFLLNKLLFYISIFFLLWTMANLIAWTNVHSQFIMLAWSFFGILLGLISISCIYFIYVFLERKDVSSRIKLVFGILLAPLILLAPTNFNLSGFNITTCDAFQFEWPPYKIYSGVLGAVAIIWILFLLIRKYRSAPVTFRKEIVLMGLGIELFLSMFFGMEFLAAYLTRIGLLPDSGIEIYGMFGMVVFIVYLNMLIVRFGVFNIKLLATQALVGGLTVLIGAQFFFIKQNINFILNGVTFAASGILGWFLIQSVKKEVSLREQIEVQKKELEVANEKLKVLDKRKTEFLSFASHQLRSPLTAVKGYASMILEGSFGAVGEPVRKATDVIMQSVQKLVVMVEDFLNITRIELGTMKYDFAVGDLRKLVESVVETMQPVAREHKLALSFEAAAGEWPIKMDAGKLSQVVSNLIDNAIKYTAEGWIKVRLLRREKFFRIEIEDSGVGIDEETMSRLFQKFSRASDASQMNTSGTGLGLYVARQLAEAHQGKLWAESPGKGQGTTFIVELPLQA